MDPSAELSYRQIMVGRFMTGLSGQEEVFAALYEEGYEPDEAVVPELLTRLRQYNYIPPAAEAEYAEALLREFGKYGQQQELGCTCTDDRPGPQDRAAPSYGSWWGRPRQTIPWYPTIQIDLCDDCGACLRFCPYGVFGTTGSGQVRVVEPFKCQVGCDACVRVCDLGVIGFPSKEILKAFGG